MKSKLFFKVYHNVYLRAIIFKYIKLFNIFNAKREFSLESINSFKYKEYLNHIKINLEDSKFSPQILEKSIPRNIESLEIFFNLQLTPTFTLQDMLPTLQYTLPEFQNAFPAFQNSFPTIYNALIGLQNDFPTPQYAFQTPQNAFQTPQNAFPTFQNALPTLQNVSPTPLGQVQPNLRVIPNIPESIKILKIENFYDIPNQYEFSNLNQLKNLHTLEAKFLPILPNSLPESLTSLFITKYSYVIQKGTLPKNLKNLYVTFDSLKEHECPIEKGSLPDTLEVLKIMGSFNFLVEKGTFPNNLQQLEIVPKCTVQLYEDFFPPSLTRLSIQLSELNIQLPNKLNFLSLFLDKNLDKDYTFAPSLEFLIIDTKSITHKNIPSNLSCLIFGYSLRPSLIDTFGISILPKTITSIDFGYFFNKPLEPKAFEGCNNLRSIRFGLSFNQRLYPTNVFPESVTSIIFKNFDNGGFPLDDDFTFPKALKYIDFGIMFDQMIGINTFSKSGNLKSIILGSAFKQKILDNSIPASVTLLELSNSKYEYSFKPIDPNNTNVKLNIFKNVILKSPFKEMITSIEYSPNGYFPNLSEGHYQSFPTTLKHLKLPFDFNDPIEKISLTDKCQLEYLEFDFSFNQPLFRDYLPMENSIKTLVLGEDFDQILVLEYFKKLETLKVYGKPKLILKANTTTLYSTPIKKNKDHDILMNYLITGKEPSIKDEEDTDKDLGDEEKEDICENQDGNIFYNLKLIETPVDNTKFLDSLNPIFFRFLKLTKKPFKLFAF
ncbi:hypothetical protein DICPUDRAFT_92319 [Dictyostelium purpureum]|uniref:FNIP repeat-containing protein n=1 Tax=Dictyostelium purpureum TaxID=5786 RepID=F0ZQ48_DICPU|nr:uncharacterized protein DICPUDRAFT_92319 [Dictyostelium purpureum]EGC33907.1 hypothetical protein DICPUDRAFT_92319 [Dictyostelium purpureum]|eukprot:XP_003289542.1 hypothetical protein DICPUDRAFT_92319 [Dictyostelium purpureum]